MARKPMRFKRYDEGGDVEESKAKQRGLEMSNKEAPVGFLERFRMGNIDDPSSEAYKRFGAGRGRLEAPAKKEESAPTRAIKPTPVARPSMKPNPIFAAGEEQGKRQPSGDASVAEYYASKPSAPKLQSGDASVAEYYASKPDAPKPAASKPDAPKPAASKPAASKPAASKPAASKPAASKPSDSGASSSTKSDASQIPGSSAKAPQGGEKIDSSETERNINAALTATGLGGAAGLFYKGKKMYDASKAAKQALSSTKRLERPGTVAGKDFVVRDYEGAAKTASKGVPKKQLSYKKDSDVTDVTPKKSSSSAKEMGEKNLRERGNKYLFGDDAPAMKRGGAVKKYASGGSVSSASSRADGIASKGKTRGRIC
jgi:hypothetical protein